MQIIFDSKDKSVVRVDKGEECLEVLGALARKRDASFHFSMIGACSSVELGYYDPVEKKYYSKEFTARSFEILSVSGNVAWQGAEPIVHAHGVFLDEGYNTFGGHVAQMTISVTCEVIINWLPEKINKKPDVKTGLRFLFK
jgi:uncharacterized protein